MVKSAGGERSAAGWNLRVWRAPLSSSSPSAGQVQISKALLRYSGPVGSLVADCVEGTRTLGREMEKAAARWLAGH